MGEIWQWVGLLLLRIGDGLVEATSDEIWNGLYNLSSLWRCWEPFRENTMPRYAYALTPLARAYITFSEKIQCPGIS